MTKKEWKEHCEKVKDLQKKYPHIPTCVFDIEASEEIVMMYEDMIGGDND